MGVISTARLHPPPDGVGGAGEGSANAARLASPLLLGHSVLILFSTLAFATILVGPLPAWIAQEPNATIYRWGWRLSGPSYVALGALAALCHIAARFGWRRALAAFAVASSLALGSELLGTTTGYPFGPYSYTPLLGHLIAGRVPFPIPISWFYMVYASLAIVSRVLSASDERASRLRWALLGGAVLTAWDVAMDPAMSSATKHWVWHVEGAFYGMPWTNWVGWYLTGVVISYALLAVVPPTKLAERVAPSRAPLLLYAMNGLMPVVICVRGGLWYAAAGGALAMGLPLFVALRSRPADAPAARARADALAMGD